MEVNLLTNSTFLCLEKTFDMKEETSKAKLSCMKKAAGTESWWSKRRRMQEKEVPDGEEVNWDCWGPPTKPVSEQLRMAE